MMIRRILSTLALLTLLLPLMVSAATKEEAKALAEKAAAYIEEHGIEKSLPAMHDKGGEFNNGELYVFALDFDGVEYVNGANPKLEGKNLNNLKDPNGVYLVREMGKMAKENGKGWVDYMWKHPATNKLTPKVSYVVRIGDTDTYAGVGIYTE